MAKKWSIGCMCLIAVMLTFLAGITAWIDPYFHYHKPIDGVSYYLNNERYQNDGIVKHFDYDAIITGTSMTECFRPSEADALFGTKTIKVPFSGSTFKEVDNNLRRAIAANPNLKMVIRCLDGYMLYEHKDAMRTDAEFPDYLYDYNLFNDVKYVFNKHVLFRDIYNIYDLNKRALPGTTFDEYANWSTAFTYSPESVLTRTPWAVNVQNDGRDMEPIYPEQEEILRQNILQNVVAVVEENPDITFYFYFPPYSIVWWSGQYSSWLVRNQIDAYRITTELLLPYENARVFSFAADEAVVLDLYNYKDLEHHSQDINSYILQCMQRNTNRLTIDNYEEYWQQAMDLFMGFDYEAYFAPWK